MAGRHRLALRRHRPALDLDWRAPRGGRSAPTWGEVQGDMITLEGPRTKNGKAHLIPLSAPALELLQAVPRHWRQIYILPSTASSRRLELGSGEGAARQGERRDRVAGSRSSPDRRHRLAAAWRRSTDRRGPARAYSGLPSRRRWYLPATRLCRREARRRRAVGRARHGSDRGAVMETWEAVGELLKERWRTSKRLAVALDPEELNKALFAAGVPEFNKSIMAIPPRRPD